MSLELLIQNGNSIYMPSIKEGVTWTTERKGMPGKLIFTAVNDDVLNFEEGNAVRVKYNGEKVFYGFVFTKKPSIRKETKTTAYDQLRYFKNKDTYAYTNKTATQLIKMIAQDFKLNVGDLEDTEYNITSRIEDNQTLFDIIQNALDMTLRNRKKMYVLYDNFGRLVLKNVETMKLNLLIDEETGESYDYSSSIDSGVYNKIKLAHENKETGKREIYIAQDSSNINKWGVLQYTENIENVEVGALKAQSLLELHNQKARRLSVKKAFGDIRARAGASVVVMLDLGDAKVKNYMMIEKATHTFKESSHTMDLTLRGGGFIA